GMPQPATIAAEIGLDFPRELPSAIDTATAWWVRGHRVNRREFNRLTFAAAAFTMPTTRWLVQPADASAATQHPHPRARRIGAADIAELHEAAEHARRSDSKYGGGSYGASMVDACLRERAVPLLNGAYSDAVGRELFAVTAQLGRLAGYSAWDVGDQARAQRHYIQALRLARAAGDVALGGYVLASMSPQAGLNDFCEDAVDTAQGAYERARHSATPRTLAFFKLVEARAHARAALHGRAHASRAVAVKPDDTRHAALLACRSSIVSMVAGCGSLIHAFWGSAGGTGLRRNRSGWAALASSWDWVRLRRISLAVPKWTDAGVCSPISG